MENYPKKGMRVSGPSSAVAQANLYLNYLIRSQRRDATRHQGELEAVITELGVDPGQQNTHTHTHTQPHGWMDGCLQK